MPEAKCCVYVLRSCGDRSRYDTGLTSDWHARLEVHNAGRCPHTQNGGPWEIDIVIEFADERRAVAFERYLKSGSGCAFAPTPLAVTPCAAARTDAHPRLTVLARGANTLSAVA